MLQIQEQIKKLKSEISDIDKIILNETYSKTDISKIEYFVSRIVTLAETTSGFNGSSAIARIRELQRNPVTYYEDLHIIVANAKGLLDSLDVYLSQ